MRINISKIVGSTELLYKEQADKLVNNLSKLDWLKIKNVTISFDDVKLINLDFLLVFMEFIYAVDMQDVDDVIHISLKDTSSLQNELITEAFKTVWEKHKNGK